MTYSGPIVFLSTDHWKQIHASLATQLPLRNLHWKSTSRNALRSIQELGVKLVPLETLREDQATSQIPQSVLEKPLLHLYIFICEVNKVLHQGHCECPHDAVCRTARHTELPSGNKSKSGMPKSARARTKNGSSSTLFDQTRVLHRAGCFR